MAEQRSYADVVTYDQLETIPRGTPTAFVDMAGNGPVTERVHEHFADNLKFSLMVGMSHWDAGRARGSLPGPKIVPFLSSHVERRHRPSRVDHHRVGLRRSD
jgi:hypothetical protein